VARVEADDRQPTLGQLVPQPDASGRVSIPILVKATVFSRSHIVIASGQVTTFPSISLRPVSSTTQIAVCSKDTQHTALMAVPLLASA